MNIEAIKNINNYVKQHSVDENMYNSDGTLSQNNCKSTGIIAKIFTDHWQDYYGQYKDFVDLKGPNANDEVQKIIDCYNHNLGYAFYECPECGEFEFCYNTCKGRLCSSCGIKRQKIITENILETCYNVNHRQLVFTIPKELRLFFFDNPKSLSVLFDAVNETIHSICDGNYNKKKKKKKKKKKSNLEWLPGFFAFLHTFGRSLQWNPHIHVLLAEGKIGGETVYRKWNYLNYDALSKRFQVILYKKMETYFGDKFKAIKNQLYCNHKNGLYVYAEPKKFSSLENGVMYVSRYSARCAIGENRIKNYDGKNVTYFYNDHKDDSYHEVTVSAFEFITLIIGHLMPKHFKIVRYYGFYRVKSKFHDKIKLMISKEKRAIRHSLLSWRNLILHSFDRDPLECPKCGSFMNFMYRVT